jgi:hypothetical protein
LVTNASAAARNEPPFVDPVGSFIRKTLALSKNAKVIFMNSQAGTCKSAMKLNAIVFLS